MLSQTFSNTLRQWHLLVLLFLLTLLPALPSALAFFGTLTSEGEGSLAPLQMLPGFNYTVFADFMHDHGRAIWPLIRTGWWTVVLSLLISIWAKGGVLYSLTNSFSAVTFWQAGTHYFGRNLRLLGLTSLFVLLWLLVLILVGILVGLLLELVPGNSFSERGYVAIGAMGLLLFGFALIRILCTSQYASVLMYQQDETAALRAYGRSWRFVGQHARATFGRYLLLILIGTVLLAIYLLFESLFQAHNWLLIGLLFVLQQAFVFSRVVLNVWSLHIALINSNSLPHPVMRSVPPSRPDHPPIQPADESDTADNSLFPS
ncbi:hypothetical protein [uncultured Fibrella sp.]|uniref:hypothetical protein n=1 Tax=uncultured Fibrella sp. TaxID=1284596 RepID=UPI0035C9BEB7